MAKRWYIVHTYSNFENKVADSIREQAKHRHLDSLFEEIIVPTEKLLDVRHGQKHATERRFFPGYVLAKVELTDEAYHLIKIRQRSLASLAPTKSRYQFLTQRRRRSCVRFRRALSDRSLWSPSKWASRSTCWTAHSLPSTPPSKRSTILGHGSRLPSRSLDDRRRLSSSLAKCKKSKTCCTDNFILIDYHLTQRR
jgi:hypothetical protein